MAPPPCKCGQPAAAHIVQYPFCRACLERSVRSRFRSACAKTHSLGNPRLQECAVLAFSGGAASSLLLAFVADLVRAHTHPNAPPPIRPVVVHVDESAVLGQPLGTHCDAVCGLAASLGHDAVVVLPLESALAGGDLAAFLDAEGGDERAALRQLLAGIPDPALRHDMVVMLRDRVLVAAALEAEAASVIRGDCADRLAGRALSGLAKGRGFDMGNTVAGIDRRRAVPIRQPFKDVLAKEIGVILRHRGIEAVAIPNLSTADRAGRNTNVLTETLLASLQSEHGHTISTIVRTAAKMQTPVAESAADCCLLCSSAIAQQEPAELSPVSDLVGARASSSSLRLCFSCRQGQSAWIGLDANKEDT